MESKFSAAASSSTVPFPIKRLTPKEMEAKREKGLCYNCDETWPPMSKETALSHDWGG